MRVVLYFSILFTLFWCVSCGQTPAVIQIAAPTDSASIARGQYLVRTLAACGFCHGESEDPSSLLIGGKVRTDRYGEAHAPNLTPAASGISALSPSQLVTAVRTSRLPEERYISPEFHRGYEWLSDEDAYAVAGYLLQLPPVEHSVPRRDVGFMSRNTVGLFERKVSDEDRYVPSVPRKHEVAFGQYLTNHVARCGSCHNTTPGLIAEGRYLGGGDELTIQGKTKLAPNISGSDPYGIGKWSDQEIVNYLRSGISPDKRQVDLSFCPVRYYARAEEGDLLAIARFLKTVAY